MSTTSFKAVTESVKHWYIPLITGILLVIVGFIVFSTPLTSYLALAIMFSISFLISGLLQIAFSIANRDELDSWGWYLAGGILYTLCGIFLLARPEISITTLPFVVGFFILFKSVSALGWAFDLKKMGISKWGIVAIVGALGVIFSFILIWNPLFAGLSLVICTGLAFVFAGISNIMLSWRLRRIKTLSGRISGELKKRIENVKREFHEEMSRKFS